MKTIKLIIDDTNHYFAAGLQFSIIEYARDNNKKVTFLTQPNDERPDVVFVSSLRRAGRWRSHAGRMVTIRERKLPAAYDNGWGLERCASQRELFTLLDRIFAYTHHVSAGAVNPLTEREKQVVNYLRCGFDQSQTANILGISVKTVHSHKRSVMGKLLLNRNHDFMYWLLSEKMEYA
ncbi:LuxR family transcriptional regulator [Serratia nematodiphila]|nr:LuxR family transcriptional regulator [Serratia nematodiphila]